MQATIYKSNNNSKLKYFILTIFWFLYLFRPPIPHIHIIYMLDIVCVIVVLYNILFGKLLKRINISLIKCFFGFIPFLLYSYINIIINFILDSSNSVFISSLHFISSIVFHLFLSILFLLSCFSDKEICDGKYLIPLLGSGLIQFILVLISYWFEPIHSIFLMLMAKYSGLDVFKGASRAYGYADNLFDILGYRISLLAIISFVLGIDKQKIKYYLYLLSFIFITFLDSRTGVLLFIVCAIVSSLMYFPHFSLNKRIKYLCLFIFLSIFFIFSYFLLPEKTQIWINNGFISTHVLISEQRLTGVYGEILGNDFIFPNNIWFGDGGLPRFFNIYGIDSGYINELWLFGSIGLMLYFFGFIFFAMFLLKKIRLKADQCLVLSFVIIYILYTFKTLPLQIPGANTIIFGFPVLFLVKEKELFYQNNQ